PVSDAILYCTGEKVNVDTVALPVINDPNCPKYGATNIHIEPNVDASACAIYWGILIKSFVFNPEFVNTCTNARVNISDKPASLIDISDSFAALLKFEKDLRWINTAETAANIKMVPGE